MRRGSSRAKLTAPHDFGGVHDIYAVVNGVQVAKGGFLIARTATISPKRGPIGTMITVTYNGLGSSLYEGGASLLYDNHYVGAMMANWTRGTAVAHIRATGPVGRHTIEAADAISFKYLNIQQSPIPWGTGANFAFNVTKDNGRPKAADRLARERRADARREDDAQPRLGRHDRLAATASLASTTGTVNSKVDSHRRRPDAERAGRPGVGDRRRQPRQLHRHVLGFVSVPLGNANRAQRTARWRRRSPSLTGSAAGTSSSSSRTARSKAQVPYFVKRSIFGNGVSSLTLKGASTSRCTSRASAGRSSTTRSRSTTTTATSGTAAASTATATR